MEPKTLMAEIFARQELLQATFSSPIANISDQAEKVVIRPVLVKDRLQYQVTEFKGPKTFHGNFSQQECQKLILEELLAAYKQALICTSQADYQILTGKKGKTTILKKPSTRSAAPLTHNRKKKYILEEGTSVPFFIELGVMTAEGKIIAKKSDKFKQLNRFLEMIQDVVPHLNKNKKLHIIDFGCGKAYLTFALYHYLHHMLGYDVEIVGLDLKKDVVEHCDGLAKKLNFEGLRFQIGDINHFETKTAVDMVVTLHACDTATDAALEKAINWNAEVILSVPCCQHELFKQIRNEALEPLLKHGILKERFAALATDAARAQILEIKGYQAQILEFIDLEHTPKNLLIRAVKRKKKAEQQEELMQAYLKFKRALGIEPDLEKRVLDNK